MISSVRVAAERLRAVGARPTPVLRSDWVDATAGCACYLKAEHLQRTGSFKYRGATNAVAGLDAASAALGVVCHSSGNHGAALAAAAAPFFTSDCSVAALVGEGLKAGALGFSTSRTSSLG